MKLLWFALLALSVVLLLSGSDVNLSPSEALHAGKIWGEFIYSGMPLVEEVHHQWSGAGRSTTAEITILWRVRLCEVKGAIATHSVRYWLLQLLKSDDSLCLEIWYNQPGQFNGGVDYTVMEEIYDFLIGQGLYGRVLTKHEPGVDVDKPEIFIAQRIHPVAEKSVPSGVVKLAEEFLAACVKRDQSAVELFSRRVRQTFNDEELQSFILGTSNPHHCGYFIHSIAPYQDGWTVVVSLFDHYTGHNLDLDPEKNQRAFYVIREGGRYTIDSLPYAGEETTQLVQDGTAYFLHLSKLYSWGSCSLPKGYTFSVYVGNKLLYRVGSFWLSVNRIEDVTGDGLKEVVLKKSAGGNCVCCSDFYVLRLVKSKVTQLWPDKNVMCPHDDCGCRGMLKDLDGDGIPELLTTDTRFGYWGPLSNYCTAGQPYVPVVYSWDGSHYRYASMDFPEAYQDILERIQSTASKDVRNIDPYGEYGSRVYSLFSELVQLMLCYDHIRMKKEGWDELQTLIQEWDFARIWDAYAIEHKESPLHVYLDDLHEKFFGVANSS